MKQLLSTFPIEPGNSDRPPVAPSATWDVGQLPSSIAADKQRQDSSMSFRVRDLVGAKEDLLERKGNKALIVCRDADAGAAASAIASGGFAGKAHDGFWLQRAYIHISLFEQVLNEVIDRAKEIVSGSGDGWSYNGVSLGSDSEASRAEHCVREAVQEGARLQVGGRRNGSLFLPTILTDVPSRSRVIREEVHGPVVSILPFIEVQDAVYEASRPHNAKVSMLTKAMDSLRFERLDNPAEREELATAARHLKQRPNAALEAPQHEQTSLEERKGRQVHPEILIQHFERSH